jgi:hypothetical protein
MSVPLRYVGSIEKRQHILLIHDDVGYAQMIEFHFIKNGLLNQENCVYVTHEDSGSIVLKFLNYGIPLQCFNNGKIKVIQLHDTCGNAEQISDRCKKDVEMILGNLIPPYRIAGRIVPNVSTVEGITVQLDLECRSHSCFDDFGGSVMCTYDISKIEKTKRKSWLEELRRTHHAIIHATKFGEGSVWYSD